MSDLISREALKTAISRNREIDCNAVCDVLDIIDNAPTVELFCSYLSDGEVRQPCVESPCEHERPQGEWIGDTDYGYTCKCSKCRKTFDTDRLKMVMLDGKYELPPCCPNCGAKMGKDGEE